MELLKLKQVDSTNKYALENFEALHDRTLILSESQSSGRGRLGRQWISPPGENIYATLLLKDFSLPVHALSWMASLAALDTLRKNFISLDLWLKWPNDIYCGDKKICGILCETKTSSSNEITGIAVGIGINLNMTHETLSQIDKPATSVRVETGEKVNMKNFICELYTSLEKMYSISPCADLKKIYTRWKEENIILGKEIEVFREKNDVIAGTVEDIDPNGNLVLLVEGQGLLTLHSGDVSVKNIFKSPY